jgi:hypothetical protein
MQVQTIEIGEIIHGKKVSVKAILTQLKHHRIKNGSIMTDGVIGDSTGSVKCVWFSKTALNDLIVGNEYVFEGYLENKYGRIALQKPTYRLTKENQQDYTPEPLAKSYASPYATKKGGWGDIDLSGVFWILLIIGVIGYFIFSNAQDKQLQESGVSCSDVTSIDRNWNNDVLCTKPDGSTFYTNYSGGGKYDTNFSR